MRILIKFKNYVTALIYCGRFNEKYWYFFFFFNPSHKITSTFKYESKKRIIVSIVNIKEWLKIRCNGKIGISCDVTISDSSLKEIYYFYSYVILLNSWYTRKKYVVWSETIARCNIDARLTAGFCFHFDIVYRRTNKMLFHKIQ